MDHHGCHAAKCIQRTGLTHHQHLAIKIHVFDTQAQALHQAHARAIQQFGQQRHVAIHCAQKGGDFRLGQYRRNPPGPGRALHLGQPGQINCQHLAVQKQQSTESLIVRGHRYPALIGEHGQKLCHLRSVYLVG
jgi:hypothetical protein